MLLLTKLKRWYVEILWLFHIGSLIVIIDNIKHSELHVFEIPVTNGKIEH